jgi:hypothetical protein
MLTYEQGVEAFRVTDRLSDSERPRSWATLSSRSITGRRKPDPALPLVPVACDDYPRPCRPAQGFDEGAGADLETRRE